jgi:hypothetical protein
VNKCKKIKQSKEISSLRWYFFILTTNCHINVTKMSQLWINIIV